MTASDLLSALEPVARALESLGVRYYVGGSVASSAHGVPRASIDADVIADLRPEHAGALAGLLADAYYADEERVRAAIAARRSFNVIHLGSMFKVDVFVARDRAFDRQALARARLEALENPPAARRYPVASAEDTVLAKLEWFRAGGEASDRQWADVVGLLKALGPTLDLGHLERWSSELGVADLLVRARREAAR